MTGKTNLEDIVKEMNPILNNGEYVFVSVKDVSKIKREETICEFKEKEGTAIIIEKSRADELNLKYEFVASWITLEVHSSLEAVGLTALFSQELAKHEILCNVIAGYFHDHIFVDTKNAEKAISVLHQLSRNYE